MSAEPTPNLDLADDPPPRPEGKADVRSAVEIRADALLSDADLDDAEELWDDDADDEELDDAGELPAAFPLNDRPGVEPDEPEEDEDGKPILWFFLLVARLFKHARSGIKVTRPQVRFQVDAVFTVAQAAMRRLSQRLAAGEIKLPEWQRGMEQQIKRVHAAQALVASGGRRQFGHEERQVTTHEVARQFTHLQDFAAEVEAGLALDGRFLARAEMYATASGGTYERVLRAGDRAAGFLWERRVRHAAHSCQSCLDYEAEGWQPIGLLPAPGDACQCMGNCKCTFERSRSPTMPSLSATPTNEPPEATAVPATLTNPEKCQRRNRMAARKAVDAFPFKLYADAPPAAEMTLAAALGNDPRLQGAKLVKTSGRIPRTPDEAMAKINALRGEGQEPLTADQVHVVYMEAGNSNYISKYQMHLGLSTQRNVAAEAERGFAFMNSHRTGGVSEPTELPYGRTFAGRTETFSLEDGTRWSRVLIGAYMVKGLKLNGEMGTDDLYGAIKGGTIFDVSLGLRGGYCVCDVCGEDLNAADDEGEPLCPHVPGTTYRMEQEQVDDQAAKGVPGGVASYTLDDAHANEVSAVFDGAVPGAGFIKALSLSRSGRLDAPGLAAAREVYLSLAKDGDFDSPVLTQAPPNPGGGGRSPRQTILTRREGKAMPKKVSPAALFRFWQACGEPTDFDVNAAISELSADGDETPVPAPKPAPAPAAQPAVTLSPELSAMQQQLDLLTTALQTERKDRQKEREATTARALTAEAETYVTDLVRQGKAAAAQKTELVGLYLQNAKDDLANPVEMVYLSADGTAKRGSRLDAFKALYARIEPSPFRKEVVSGTRLSTGQDSLTDLGTGDVEDVTQTMEYRAAASWANRRNGRPVAAAK